MLEKVFYTSVLVSDQDKALDFYTNILGLEKRVENPTPGGPRFLTVGVKGDDFQLVLWPGTPGQAEPAMGRPPASITIETDDIRKTSEELKARGDALTRRISCDGRVVATDLVGSEPSLSSAPPAPPVRD